MINRPIRPIPPWTLQARTIPLSKAMLCAIVGALYQAAAENAREGKGASDSYQTMLGEYLSAVWANPDAIRINGAQIKIENAGIENLLNEIRNSHLHKM